MIPDYDKDFVNLHTDDLTLIISDQSFLVKFLCLILKGFPNLKRLSLSDVSPCKPDNDNHDWLKECIVPSSLESLMIIRRCDLSESRLMIALVERLKP